MAGRPAPASDVLRLIEELASQDDWRRESASARLIILGATALPRLAALVAAPDAAGGARLAALRTVAAIDSARAGSLAAPLATGPDDDLALAAIEVLRDHVGARDALGTSAFDVLTMVALDRSAPVARRLAAIAAFEGLPGELMQPVYDLLAQDTSSRVVAWVVRRQAGSIWTLADVGDGPLPAAPELVAAALDAEATTTAVTLLHKAIAQVRAREAEPGADIDAWRRVRGRLHQALAERGSRLALSDLRDTLASTADARLPVAFLAAATMIGNVECLEPIASAWQAAPAAERWWRDHLAAVFAAIVRRERITRQHPALKRILTKWPATGVLVAAAPRTAARRRSGQ